MNATLQYIWIMCSRMAVILAYAWGLSFIYDNKSACLIAALFVVTYSDIIAIHLRPNTTMEK